MNNPKKIKEAASKYTKFLIEELRKMYKGKYKTPMQLPPKEKKKFFEHIDKNWKSKKEALFDKKNHVVHLEKLDKASVNKYLKHYFKDFDVKDIDIEFHVDRFDLSMWAHGKDHMYSIEATYPLHDSGQVQVEAYSNKKGKGKKKVDTSVYDKFEDAVKAIKKREEKGS